MFIYIFSHTLIVKFIVQGLIQIINCPISINFSILQITYSHKVSNKLYIIIIKKPLKPLFSLYGKAIIPINFRFHQNKIPSIKTLEFSIILKISPFKLNNHKAIQLRTSAINNCFLNRKAKVSESIKNHHKLLGFQYRIYSKIQSLNKINNSVYL